MGNEELGLDHFLFYDIAAQATDEVVGVQTQFDIGPAFGPEKIRLRASVLFANPVQKNDEEILDPNAHLTWHLAYDYVPDPTRVVNYTDQFGRRRVYIGRKVALLAPTQKARRGSRFPEKLDHFVVFQVLDYSSPINKVVRLRDQWGKYEAKVYVPRFFAAPTRKWHGGDVEGVKNAKAHLAIYQISPSKADKAAKSRDQFGTRVVNARRTVFLAVPCKKGKWEAVD